MSLYSALTVRTYTQEHGVQSRLSPWRWHRTMHHVQYTYRDSRVQIFRLSHWNDSLRSVVSKKTICRAESVWKGSAIQIDWPWATMYDVWPIKIPHFVIRNERCCTILLEVTQKGPAPKILRLICTIHKSSENIITYYDSGYRTSITVFVETTLLLSIFLPKKNSTVATSTST